MLIYANDKENLINKFNELKADCSQPNDILKRLLIQQDLLNELLQIPANNYQDFLSDEFEILIENYIFIDNEPQIRQELESISGLSFLYRILTHNWQLQLDDGEKALKHNINKVKISVLRAFLTLNPQ